MNPRLPAVCRVLAAAALLALGGCSAATPRDPASGPGGTGSPDDSGSGRATVTVLAAASLTEPLDALARDYEAAHPGVTVRISYGSSTTLARQIAEGAPADVLASAGTQALDLLPTGTVTRGGRAVIARNSMEIVTPPDNPGRVATLADLGRPGLDVVLCAATVPCGTAADTMLARARVTPHVVSREVDVKATLAKVRLGEADAAVVYHSDVVSAGRAVHGVPVPAADNVTLTYPVVRVSTSAEGAGFVALLTSDAGRAALTRAGFLAP